MAENEGILDVRVELNTLDILEGANPSTPIASALSGSDEIQQRVSSGICLSPFGFASFLGIGTVVATSLSASVFYMVRPTSHKH
ncbi:unnamed protein product [Caenorhabditis bovis]|uniref:Uncharacterized protein n=1 Tax=Caenorhabditis bovis TaxID=2654633 RepID=A0A8S1EXC2_9PELO|nr:unnamed protein product [Caenorhabditis bovis]